VLSFLDYTLLNQSLAETTIPLALEHDVGIILGRVLVGSLLAGPEPHADNNEKGLIRDQDGTLPPAAMGGPSDPAVVSHAHQMWQWCKERGVNIRDLALQFALNAPVQGNGIVLVGLATPKECHEVYASATTTVPESVWQDFGAVFGVRI
jgi:aryl-alcohol dehydrogenase-like predicted oxidoreductase